MQLARGEAVQGQPFTAKLPWPYEGDRVAVMVGAAPYDETAMFRVERCKALAVVVKSALCEFDWPVALNLGA